MSRDRDVGFMRRALELARLGWGRVAPNPLVGALVVRDGEVVGEGHHGEWGGRHAEIVALEMAGPRAQGATLYVTLEPCRHHGKTGPCTEAIVKAGIARVVCAVEDADPIAAGGADALRRSGVAVEEGVCAEEASDLNAVYFHFHRRGRPFVALKYALSLDARLAERPGCRTPVTGREAIVEAHRLRAGHDVVMIGIGTALADDPTLTVREWTAPRTPPLRVVLDTRLRLPLDGRLARSAGEVPLWLFVGPGVRRERAARYQALGIEVVPVPTADASQLDLEAVIARLGEAGRRSVMCEGGGRLGTALLAAGLVDRLYAFIAPRLLGGPGVAAFQETHEPAVRDWRLVDRRGLGPDTLLVLSPNDAVAERGEGDVQRDR